MPFRIPVSIALTHCSVEKATVKETAAFHRFPSAF
jgi:hypothetical protein